MSEPQDLLGKVRGGDELSPRLSASGAFSRFAAEVVDRRVAILSQLAPKPILLDVVFVDLETNMMKVKTVMPDATEGREWWLSLGAIVTVAVIPKEPNLVQPVPSGVVLF